MDLRNAPSTSNDLNITYLSSDNEPDNTYLDSEDEGVQAMDNMDLTNTQSMDINVLQDNVMNTAGFKKMKDVRKAKGFIWRKKAIEKVLLMIFLYKVYYLFIYFRVKLLHWTLMNWMKHYYLAMMYLQILLNMIFG